MPISVDELATALRELTTSSQTTEASLKQKYVAIVVRAKELPSSFAFLVYEAQHKAFFIPSGKVEDGETLVVAAVRELAEETGLVIPRSCVVKEFRKITVMKDYEEAELHIMAVDIPLEFLINNFRDSFAADRMVRKVGIIPWVSQDAEQDVRYAKCGTSALSVPVRVPENRTVQNLVEPYKAVDHGMLVHLSAYQYALDTGSYGDLPMRYDRHESPLWDATLEALKETQPVVKWSSSSVEQHVNGAANTARKPRSDAPRFKEIDGRDKLYLYRWLRGLPSTLRARDLDPDTLEGVKAVIQCFTGDLAKWNSDWNVMGDKYHTVHDLIEAIKTTFIVRDYELENAGGLKEVCQSGKPYAVYMSNFNDSLADFNDEVSEKLKVLLFAWGLDDDSVRADIITRFRRNEWTTLVEAQDYGAKQVASRLVRTNGRASDHKNKIPGSSSEKSQQQSGKKRAPADHRGNGNGKKFKPNQGGGNQESNRRLWEACKAKWDATKLKEILDAKACLNCGRTGHRIADCRAPKPQV